MLSLIQSELLQWTVGLVFSGFVYYFGEVIVSPASRARLLDVLRDVDAAARYRKILASGLDVLDWRFPEPGRRLPSGSARLAWSSSLYEFSFSLATIYPAFFLVGAWAFLGVPGKLGDLTLLETVGEFEYRQVVMIALVVALLMSALARSRQTVFGWGAWLFASVFALNAGVYGVISANQALFGDALPSTAVVIGVTSASTVACAFALRGVTTMTIAALFAAASAFYLPLTAEGGAGASAAFAACVAAAVAVGLGVGSALVIRATRPLDADAALWSTRRDWTSGAVALGVLGGALAGPVAFGAAPTPAAALVFAVAVGLIVLLGVLVADAARRIGDVYGRPLLARTLLMLLVLAAFFAAFRYGGIDENMRMYFLMFAALPLINGLFDFLSTGMTRFALRRSLAERASPWFWFLVDALIAATLFTLLGCALIAALHFARAEGGAPLIDVAAILADLDRNPGDSWWLFATIGSTLVPSLLHLGVAVLGFFAFAPATGAPYVARLVEKGGEEGGARAIAAIILGLACVLALVAPAVVAALFALLVYGAMIVSDGAIGAGYLRVFEGFARLIGAL